jgi:ATP-dependent NAD(P)H-hydrate dehydratase
MIVLPILDNLDKNETEMRTWLSRVHSLIIGPGLGRSEEAFKSVKIAVSLAKSQNIPIIIDADGLFILSHDLNQITGYKKCILTPNVMEFKLLYDSCFRNEHEKYDEKEIQTTFELQCDAVKKLAKKLANVTIIKKGKFDIISNGNQVIFNDMDGSLKRCGGIGDILTGTIGTFSYWCNMNVNDSLNENEVSHNMIACYIASVFVKECSRIAFEKFHRSVLAVDIIEQIAQTFYEMFDKN